MLSQPGMHCAITLGSNKTCHTRSRGALKVYWPSIFKPFLLTQAGVGIQHLLDENPRMQWQKP
jgi:hypothetical protein